jgi:hypothetical protein
MTKDQDNITTMFETTNGVLDTNNAKWSGTPAFATAVTAAKSGTAAIRQKQADQETTGDTEAKQNARDAVEEQALLIGSQLSALAAETNNPMLEAKVAYDKSTMDKMAVSDLITAAKSIAKAGTDNAAVLASDYGITAAELTEFNDAITALGEMKDAPRQAAVDRKVATMSLPDAITHVRKIYRNRIDKMMEKFKKSAPDFYAAYFAARIIIDRPGGHAAPTPPGPAPGP